MSQLQYISARTLCEKSLRNLTDGSFQRQSVPEIYGRIAVYLQYRAFSGITKSDGEQSTSVCIHKHRCFTLSRPFGRAEDECSRRPLVCVLHSRHSYSLYIALPLKGAGRGEADKTKAQRTFVPLNGLATDGEPWTCKREQGKRSAASRPLGPYGRRPLRWVPPLAALVHPCTSTAGQNGFGDFCRSCSSLNPRHLRILPIGHNKSTRVYGRPTGTSEGRAMQGAIAGPAPRQKMIVAAGDSLQ